MTREEIEYLWRDPKNWSYSVYSCKADPRVVVPKRIRSMGWTINFGHPRAIPALLGLLAILFIPAPVVFFVVTLFGIGIGIEAGADARTGAGAGALIGVILGVVTFVLSIVAVCLISAKLSSRTS